MSTYVQTISEDSCITDSYLTINSNVSGLDAALVAINNKINNSSLTEGVAKVLEGHNISVLPPGNSGTGILTVGETVCPPWHIDQNNVPLYSGPTTGFELASNIRSATVELWVKRTTQIPGGSPSFFTSGPGRAEINTDVKSGVNNSSNTYSIKDLIATYGTNLNGGYIAVGAGGGSKGSGRVWIKKDVYDRSCGVRSGCAVAAINFNYTGGRLYADLTYGTSSDFPANNTYERTQAIANAVASQNVYANNVDITDEVLYSASSCSDPSTATSSNSIRLYLPAVQTSIVNLPAGWYRVVYTGGAMSYWSALPRWYSITGETVLVAFPSTTNITSNPWPAGGNYYDDNKAKALTFLGTGTFRHDYTVITEQPNAQAAVDYGLNFLGNGKPYYKNFYHPGGFLAASFGDNPYDDNRSTSPSITYDLYPLRVVEVSKTMKQVSDSKTFLKHLNDVIDENPPMPGGETVRVAGGTYNMTNSTIGAYAGGVLLQDGRVFLIPYYNTTGLIYDPKTDTTTTPAGTHPGNASYGGGVLLADGTVFMGPFYGTNRAAIYDPRTNTTFFTDILFNGQLPFYQTCGCVLLKDGRVFGVPIFATENRQTYIYNPANGTYTYTNATFPGRYAFSGGVLLPNGNVFLVPWGALQANPPPAYIYNPVTDTASVVTNWPNLPNQGFYGGILMADGRVYCIPADGGGQRAYIYDYTNGSVTQAGGLYPPDNVLANTAVQNFVGGNLLPDGRIFISPGSNQTARIYNPRTDTLETPSLIFNTNSSQDAFAGSVLMQNGEIFIVPHSFNSGLAGRIFSSYQTRNFDNAALTGPFFNYY